MKKVKPEQIARFRQYIQDGMSAREISDREGVSDDVSYLNGKLKKLAKEMGITRSKVIPYAVPYGLTDETKSLRYQLSYKLGALIDKHGKEEVARMTGVSSVRQNDAQSQQQGVPPSHNWTLAQIERLARASNISLATLLEQITQEYRYEEQKAWPIPPRY